MNLRVLGVVLVVVGVGATLVGLGGRWLWNDDEGHHDGRSPSFALASGLGADELVVEQDGGALIVALARAGQPVTSLDPVHGAPAHVFVAGTDLESYQHVDLDPDSPESRDGRVEVAIAGDGEYRVVLQTAPDDGPDLLELGTTIDVSGIGTADADAGREAIVVVDDVWSEGGLTIERQGLDFALSEPWNGEDHHGGPALLVMFRAGDMAFVHGHAEMPDDDRFRFNLDLPGRGEYLAALEFVHDGELITALFRFTV